MLKHGKSVAVWHSFELPSTCRSRCARRRRCCSTWPGTCGWRPCAPPPSRSRSPRGPSRISWGPSRARTSSRPSARSSTRSVREESSARKQLTWVTQLFRAKCFKKQLPTKPQKKYSILKGIFIRLYGCLISLVHVIMFQGWGIRSRYSSWIH